MNFLMTVPVSDAEYFLPVRLAVGGLCENAGLNIDDAEDVKVCVTESMLILKRSGVKAVSLEFEKGEKFKITIKSVEAGGQKENAEEDDEISFALLSALVDIEIIPGDGKAEAFVLSKNL